MLNTEGSFQTHNDVYTIGLQEKSNLIDNSLDQVELSLQRRVQQQSQRIELHPHAVVDAFRSRLA